METWTRSLVLTVSLDFFFLSNTRNQGDKNGAVWRKDHFPLLFFQSSQFTNDHFKP